MLTIITIMFLPQARVDAPRAPKSTPTSNPNAVVATPTISSDDASTSAPTPTSTCHAASSSVPSSSNSNAAGSRISGRPAIVIVNNQVSKCEIRMIIESSEPY